MLCFQNDNIEYGTICTNRCDKWADCERRKAPSHMKIPFLIETVDILVQEIEPQVIDGIHVITYRPVGISPQATEHGVLEEISPSVTAMEKDTFKPTYYSNLLTQP